MENPSRKRTNSSGDCVKSFVLEEKWRLNQNMLIFEKATKLHCTNLKFSKFKKKFQYYALSFFGIFSVCAPPPSLVGTYYLQPPDNDLLYKIEIMIYSVK